MPDESLRRSSTTDSPPFRKLLLLAAMDAELQAVLSQATFAEQAVSPALKLNAYLHHGAESTLGIVCCGVGPVNAGAALALLCDKSNFDAALLIGIAGALSSSLHTGQLVVAKEVIQHDSTASMPEGMLLIPPGEPHLVRTAGTTKLPSIPCSGTLVNYLSGLFTDDPALKPAVGTFLSGSEFACTKERKLELTSRFPEALCIDMEAAGAALIARRLKLPFSAVKVVADELEYEFSPAKFKHKATEALAATALFAKRLIADLELSE